jgi:hydrogenase-4 component E
MMGWEAALKGLIDTLIVFVVLANLRLLGASRLGSCIRVVAVQGILLGLIPVLSQGGNLGLRVVLQAAVSTILKGIVFPALLIRAVRESGSRKELAPIVGYTPSLLAGGGLLALALWLGGRLPLPPAATSSLLVPVALFTIMVGLFMIVARRKAITQVLGYLAMENGIFAFGLAFAEKEPFLVEMGILLDAFMAVFVMGIMVYQINREFDHIDADRLSELRD